MEGNAGRFLGLWSTFVSATFAYLGTELVGVTVGEAQNPRRTIPRAIRLTFYRIVFFYVLSVFLLGMLVPYDSPELVAANKKSNSATASPFVVAIVLSGIPYLPGILNACILIFVFSASNSGKFFSSFFPPSPWRETNDTIYRFVYCVEDDLWPSKGRESAGFPGQDGQARCPLRRSRVQRAVWIVGFHERCRGFQDRVWLLCQPCYHLRYVPSLASIDSHALVILIFFSTSFEGILTWISILVSHIYFVRARRAQGVTDDQLAYTAPFGAAGSYGALFLCILIAVFKNFNVFTHGTYGKWDYKNFVTGYLGIPLYLIMIFGYKFIYKNSGLRPEEADLFTGKDKIDREEAEFLRRQEEKGVTQGGKFYEKFVAWLF